MCRTDCTMIAPLSESRSNIALANHRVAPLRAGEPPAKADRARFFERSRGKQFARREPRILRAGRTIRDAPAPGGRFAGLERAAETCFTSCAISGRILAGARARG